MKSTTESKWRQLIEEQEASGMTVREFAQLRDLSPGTLYWWRSKLGRKRSPRSRSTTEAPELVPVTIRESLVVATGAPFEVRLRDDLCIAVPASFDAAALRRLIEALQPC